MDSEVLTMLIIHALRIQQNKGNLISQGIWPLDLFIWWCEEKRAWE